MQLPRIGRRRRVEKIMLNLVVFAATLASSEHDATAFKLIRAMESKYQTALTLSGRIIGAFSAGNQAVETITDIKYVRPALLDITETKLAANGGTYSIKSDGKTFSYGEPLDNRFKGRQRLYEDVRRQNGYLFTINDIYFAGFKSLPAHGTDLDIVLGMEGNLADWHKRLLTMQSAKTATLHKEKCKVIEGNLSPFSQGDATGRYEIWIGPDKLMRRYVEVDHVIDRTPNMPVIDMNVATVYDFSVQLDTNLPSSLFSSGN